MLRMLHERLAWHLTYGRGTLAASWLRKQRVKAAHPRVTVRFGNHSYLGPGFELIAAGSGSLTIGDRVEFRRGCRIELGDGGCVEIGDDSHFSYNAVIASSGEVIVGRRCLFGFSSSIFDGNHRFDDLSRPISEQGYDLRRIVVGDDVLVSAHTTIVNSVGQRAVIGANAVVSKPVPPYTVAVGAPAVPVRSLAPDSSLRGETT